MKIKFKGTDIWRVRILQTQHPEDLSFAFDTGAAQVQEEGLCLITLLHFPVAHRELLENIS